MRGSAAFRTSITPGGALAGPWVRNPLWNAARAVPSLDLRFADNKSLVDATTGQNLVTFTRASSGTYVDSQGVIRTATTNLLLRSEEFNNASWATLNATVTANQTIAPNGTLTADQFVENSAGTARLGQVVAATPGVFYTASIYLKAGTNSIINWREDAEDVHGIQIDLATGSITNGTGTIVPVGNDWYRVSFTGSVSGTTFKPEIRAANSPGTIFIWGAQLEQSSTVGEYIPTTSTINSAPRFDHNPTTGESLGLLVEEQRTNLSLQSDNLSDVYWAKVDCTITANQFTAPDGTLTADLWTNIPTAGGAVNNSMAKDASIRTYTASMWVNGTSPLFTMTLDFGGTVNRGRVQYNLATNTIVGTTNTGNFTGTSGTITPYANGWARLTLTTTTSTGTTIRFRSFFGTGGESVYVWGAQVEEGAFPTSYIPTTTAAVTRSADVASITGSNFSSWYRQDEGTVFVDAAGVSNLGGATRRYCEIKDNASSERVILGYSALNNNRFLVVDNSSTVADITATSSPTAKAAGAYKVNSFQLATNGTLGTEDGVGTVPTPDQMFIGSQEGSSANTFLNGTIRRLTYWPQRLSNTTLQQITQ